MTKYEQEEDKLRSAEKWNRYFDGDETDLALKDSPQDKPEFYYQLSAGELSSIKLLNKWVLVDIDELTEIKLGKLTFVLPDDFAADQNNTFHQSVSGVVVRDSVGIKDGTRVFFHYLSIINAKIRQSGGGLILLCEGKSYILVDRKTIYVGILDGELLALHPDFCITEPIERQNVVRVGDLITDDSGEVQKELAALPYDPFRCKIVALPSTENMEEDRKFAMLRVVNTMSVDFQSIKDGDTVRCRKAWNIPIDNGIQKYLGFS